MNLKRLYEILNETTVQLRKGEVVTESKAGPINVTTIDAMPHQDEAPETLIKVDMEFLVIGVDKEKAEARKDELIAILNDYPDPFTLAGGPSYIAVGGELGDQGAAFQLFALGKVLGLWDVVTPRTLGFSGKEATEMAGRGFVMITGYKKKVTA